MSTENPHDSLFRYAFDQPEVAVDHFRAVLPPAVVDAVRWDTLEPVPGTFVNEELKQLHTDALYRVELEGSGSLWLYVLFEHQRKPDPRMAWRLLRYMVRIWDRFTAEDTGPLPCILPLVLYNGERPWNAPLDLHGLLGPGVSEVLLPGVPQFQYHLLDLSQVDDAELQGLALRRLVLLLLKHAHEEDFWDRFPAWLDSLEAVVREPRAGLRALEAVWRYVLSVTPRDLPEGVRTLLMARLPQDGGRMVMTWGERLEERGREQGRQEGRHEGQAITLIRLIRAKFGPVPDHIESRVRQGREDELERWTDRILTADSIEALFT
jgi:predicted transposase/invertase (TIGR01784 family)